MVSSIGNSISAINAFTKKMDVTANNIANVATNDFKKSKADIIAGSDDGVRVDITQVNTPGHSITENQGVQERVVESSNVDLTEELTEIIPIQIGYQANLKSVMAQDKMLGNLFDITA